MASFMTRVELHGADDDDYQTLHEAMEEGGFSRTIVSSQQATYHLPPAEYYFSGETDRSTVLQKAKTAAKTTGKEFAIVVTESNGVTWYNLPKL
jgi:hypothetical protein